MTLQLVDDNQPRRLYQLRPTTPQSKAIWCEALRLAELSDYNYLSDAEILQKAMVNLMAKTQGIR
jgi:hypothetical protein